MTTKKLEVTEELYSRLVAMQDQDEEINHTLDRLLEEKPMPKKQPKPTNFTQPVDEKVNYQDHQNNLILKTPQKKLDTIDDIIETAELPLDEERKSRRHWKI